MRICLMQKPMQCQLHNDPDAVRKIRASQLRWARDLGRTNSSEPAKIISCLQSDHKLGMDW